MPQGKKTSSSTNNKNKKGQRRSCGITGRKVGGGIIASSDGARNIPSRNHFVDDGTSFTSSLLTSSTPKLNLSTTYQGSKEATERFMASLLKLVTSITSISSTNPSTWNDGIGNSSSIVQSLVDAVDYLRDQSQKKAPPGEENWMVNHPGMLLHMMDDLKMAISVRRRFLRSYILTSNRDSNTCIDNVDEVDDYFLKVLNYCWIALKPIVRQHYIMSMSSRDLENKKDNGSDKDDDDDLDSIRNQFNTISIDEALDDTGLMDTVKAATGRPVLAAQNLYTMHDLTDGSDYIYTEMFSTVWKN